MAVLKGFNLLKTESIHLLESLESVLSESSYLQGIFDDAKLRAAIQGLKSDKFIIAVVGVIKRGKSTLLNALMRAETDILATNVTPETARLAYLNYSPQPHAIVHMKDKSQRKVEVNELPKYTSAYDTPQARGEKDKVEATLFSEIYLPNDLLKQDICIVDTPGVDDPDVERSNVTLDFIQRADAVVFMIDVSEGGLKASEFKFLSSKIMGSKGTSKGIIIACNKISQLRRHQRSQLDDLVNDTSATVKKSFGVDIPVLKIDALDAVNGFRYNDEELVKRSGVVELQNGIEKYIVSEKGRRFLRRRISQVVANFIDPAIEELELLKTQNPQSIEDLERQVRNARQKVENTQEKAKNLEYRFRTEKDAIKNKLKRNIASRFRGEIDYSISAVESIPKAINGIIRAVTGKTENEFEAFFDEYRNELKQNNIRIAKIELDVPIANLNISKYYSVREVEKTDNSGTGIGAAIGGALGAIVLGPIGLFAGAFFGGLFGSNDVTRKEKVTEYDAAKLQRAVQDIEVSVISALENQIEVAFEELLDDVDKSLKNSEMALKKRYQTQMKALAAETRNRQNELNELSGQQAIITDLKRKLNRCLEEADAL